jgi:hypothetical protein
MGKVDFYLGSDPELMLRDSKSKALRSAIPLIPEGKGKGRPLGNLGLSTVLHDNVLVEFNTKPASNQKEFVHVIGFSLREINRLAAKQGLELHFLTAADFPEEELANEEARVFGCEPDFDAYTVSIQTTDPEAAFLPFRSAGGHLHIGFKEEDTKLAAILKNPHGKINAVKALDIFVGIPSIFLDKDPSAPSRRKLYGKAGSHRPKTYGVEWRSCSPWWLASPRHCALAYQMTKTTMSVLCQDGGVDAAIEAVGGERTIQSVINNSQVERARKIYRDKLASYYPKTVQTLVELIDAMSNEKALDIHSNWKLKS